MTLSEQQSAFAVDAAKLVLFIAAQGYLVTKGESWRSEVEAWINALPAGSLLTAQSPHGGDIHYHDTVGGYGIQNSLHKLKLADDYNCIRDGVLVNDKINLQPVGDYWESLNPLNRWGGNFHDRQDTDHFERQRA